MVSSVPVLAEPLLLTNKGRLELSGVALGWGTKELLSPWQCKVQSCQNTGTQNRTGQELGKVAAKRPCDHLLLGHVCF